jgi:tRNA U34 5-carboxymethylaminomethyl modifying enzyme MnmG/GidA
MTYLKNKGLSSVPTLSKKYKNSVCSLYELLKRQTVHLKDVLPAAKFKTLTQPVIDKIEIMIKFEGYIKKQDKYIDKFKK